MSRVYTNGVEAEYYPVSRPDFFGELKAYISDKEIKDYNKALPSEETLKIYIEKYMEYKRVRDFGAAVTVYINNIDTAKATDTPPQLNFLMRCEYMMSQK